MYASVSPPSYIIHNSQFIIGKMRFPHALRLIEMITCTIGIAHHYVFLLLFYACFWVGSAIPGVYAGINVCPRGIWLSRAGCFVCSRVASACQSGQCLACPFLIVVVHEFLDCLCVCFLIHKMAFGAGHDIIGFGSFQGQDGAAHEIKDVRAFSLSPVGDLCQG